MLFKIKMPFMHAALSVLVLNLFAFAIIACMTTGTLPSATPSFVTVAPVLELDSNDDEQPPPLSPYESGGTLRIETVDSIVPDPAFEFGKFSPLLNAEVFSGLVKIVDDINSPFELDLAERYEVSNGGMTYEFVLKRDLVFSDGSPLTAHDFAWSWARALNPATGSLRAVDVLGAIEGAGAIARGADVELHGVEVIDDRTLRITLSYPDTGFLAALSHTVASVLKPSNVANWGVDFSILRLGGWVPARMDELPVGTGPFKIEEYDFESGRVRLTRNEHYHGGLAKLGGIEFVPSVGPEIDAFANFEVDYTEFFPLSALSAQDDTHEVDVPRSPSVDFLVLNAAVPPFDDVNVRRALVASVDVGSLRGIWPVASGILNPVLPGFNSELPFIRYDPAKAVELLAESRYADEIANMKLTYHNFNQGRFADGSRSVVDGWSEVLGLDFSIIPVVGGASNSRTAGGIEIQVTHRHVEVSYPSQEEILREFVNTFSETNDSPEVTKVREMFNQTRSEADAAKRQAAYAEIERYILEEALIVPLYWTSTEYGRVARIQHWVEGFNPSPYDSGSRFKDVWLNENAPTRGESIQ